MSTLCKHRIDTDNAYGLCTVGSAELGTHTFSRCHQRLCAACTKSGEETKNVTAPNMYLASVLVDAANTGLAQSTPFQSKDILRSFADRWKGFLKVITKAGKDANTIKSKYKRPNRCEHRGALPVERRSCQCPMLHVYECGKYADASGNQLQIIPARQCELCPGYEDSEEEN